MAKLTESYLRKLIKQSLNEMNYDPYLDDLEDEAYSAGEQEVMSAREHDDEVFAALEEIDHAILDLQNDEVESALATLKDARALLSSISGKTGYAVEAAAKKASDMGRYAYKSGMPSAGSEFGTTRSMDESRRRKLAPKRK